MAEEAARRDVSIALNKRRRHDATSLSDRPNR